ncbi:MAG TPA: GvpL/GvpF family gas vesicle protein [Longimicrobiales bacterium]|nr:GvpL/GvpF family gas vesicle protein [Longimicrobiales bacterium]
MEGLYLYAVLPAATPPPAPVRGLEGEEVRLAAAGPLSLWCSALAGPPPATVERARRHHAVVAAAFAAGDTPLPLRYGQWVEDARALERWGQERGAALGERLAQVAGTAEFGIRVARGSARPPEAARIASTPGKAHMERLAARFAAREGGEEGCLALERLRAALGDLVRDERVDPPGERAGLLAVAHLVPREAQDEYRARVRDVRERVPDLRFLVTGPWPPYSFSE